MTWRSRLAVVAVLVGGLLVLGGGVASAKVTFTDRAMEDLGIDADGNPIDGSEGVLADAWRLFWLAPEGQRMWTFVDGIDTEFIFDTPPEADVGGGDAYGTAKVLERNAAGIPTKIRIFVRRENFISDAWAADTIWHEFRHGEIWVMGGDQYDHVELDGDHSEVNEKFRKDVERVEESISIATSRPRTPGYDRIMEEARQRDEDRRAAILIGDILEDIRDSISFNDATFTSGYIDIEQYGYDKWGYGNTGVTITFNESTFECGDRGDDRIVVCADQVLPMPNDVIMAVAIMHEDIPLSGPDHLIYGAVFDGDRDAADDWVAIPPFDWDLFQGTDRWYELVYDAAAGRWSLLVTQLSPSGQIVSRGAEASSARVVVEGDTVVFFIGADEFAAARPAVRLTAFGHDGLFSQSYRGGDVSGIDPTRPPAPVPADPAPIP